MQENIENIYTRQNKNTKKIIFPELNPNEYNVEYDPSDGIYHVRVYKNVNPLLSDKKIFKRHFENAFISPLKIESGTYTYQELVKKGILQQIPSNYLSNFYSKISQEESIISPKKPITFNENRDYYWISKDYINDHMIISPGRYAIEQNGHVLVGKLKDDVTNLLVLTTYRRIDDFALSFEPIDIYYKLDAGDINPELYNMVPAGFGFWCFENISKSSSIYFINKQGEVCRISDHFLSKTYNEYPHNTVLNIVYGLNKKAEDSQS